MEIRWKLSGKTIMLIDTHSHIQFNAYKDDMEEVIKRAREARVFMIAVGSQKDTSTAAVRVAEAHPDLIWAAIGLHPNHLQVMHFDDGELEVKARSEEFDPAYYRGLAQSKSVVGIGECGLDYYRMPEELDRDVVIAKQKQVFRQQLNLADELNLPVIVHVREAHDDTYEILKEYVETARLKRRGVIHCFTAGRREVRKYVELGFYIGFGGVITFKSKKPEHQALLETAKEVPIDRVVIETDAPYLTPEPFRGKRNESSYIKHVAEKLAELHSTRYDEIAQATTENANRLFNIEIGLCNDHP